MKSLRVRTPAKVNLFLRVLGARPDGYHDLETLFQAIDLEDELILRATTGEPSIEVPGFPELETKDNLVLKAVRRLESDTGRKLGVRITVHKKIPVAAGLGGGSSDAAATLRGVVELCNLSLTAGDLAKAALALGADVPFFLMGGSAVGEGVGERLTPVRMKLDYGMVLVSPGFPVSTAAVFREFSRTLTGARRAGRLWSLIRERSALEKLLHNDLQAVTENLHPEIGAMCGFLERSGIRKALMSGSGPTVFGPAPEHELSAIMKRLPAAWKSLAVRPTSRGIIVD
jgi:4-diphosphocytidyl-2-C-methyl-D-erythritol kinase